MRLDGTVEVMLPDSSSAILPLERLTRLYDGLEQLEEMWGDDMSEEHDSLIDEDEEAETWATNEQGEWVRNEEVDAEDWSTDDEGMDIDEDGWSSSDPTALQPSEDLPPLASLTPDEVKTPEALSVRPISPDVPKDIAMNEDVHINGTGLEPNSSSSSVDADLDIHWKRFEILASAPVDHAFYGSIPAQPSRSFLARLNKEYRVLASSLPGKTALELPTNVCLILHYLPRNYPSTSVRR